MSAPPNTDSSANLRAVVLTAILLEFEAVCAHLRDCREDVHENGDVYQKGFFDGEDGVWEVLVVETGSTNQEASYKTERALQHFKPSVALFVGVAGGLKDVGIGDVVAATQVYGYESGKVSASFESRPRVGRSSGALESRASSVIHSKRWHSRIKGRSPGMSPRAFIGPIASGEKVVADTRSGLRELLRNHFSDALAVEMEGSGFLSAARDHEAVSKLVVRGISDLIDGKSAADASGSQELAARHASAFAFEVLSKFAKTSSVSGPQPVLNASAVPAKTSHPSTVAAEQPTAPRTKSKTPPKSSGPSVLNLRTVVILVVLAALGYMALGMLGRHSRPTRGVWTHDQPSSRSRGDWRRGAPTR